MISNDTNEEKIEKARSLAIGGIARNSEKVSKSIDDLSSSGLKRVLKTICHVHIAEEMLGKGSFELEEKEQVLIDQIFNLMEDVMSYTQLMNEINAENTMEVSDE
jgi:hypothetical protein